MNVQFKNPAFPPLRVAVVGSGISGSSAAWALNPVHDVTLYESQDRPGGHTATVDVDHDGVPVAVDTGFIVYNEANYPDLTALFAHLGVTTHESDMSFSLSLDHGRLEWCGDSLASVFAQKRNLFRPSFLLMLRDVLRFNRLCLADRAAGRLAGMSVGDYLDWRGFSPGFANNYLLPMAAAIWSTPARSMMEFPAERLVHFFDNHRLVHARHRAWRTVTGGSRNYLEKLLAPLEGRIRLDCGVLSVRRHDGKVHILDASGREEIYDRIVIAAHSDQALAMLDDPSPEEREVLSAIPYRANRVVLHRDDNLMPRRRRAWASWNYLRSSRDDGSADVAVTYWMNRLQGIDVNHPLFVTLNPDREPARETVLGEYSYDHPQFGGKAMEMQERLPLIQGRLGTWFAGAWTGYGFHEDGLSSGLAAAEALGGIVPWRRRRTGEPAPALQQAE